jgi:hypothetical protein
MNRPILVVGKMNHERGLGITVLGLGFLDAFVGLRVRRLTGSGFFSLLAIKWGTQSRLLSELSQRELFAFVGTGLRLP